LGPSASRATVGDWWPGWSVDGSADDGDHGAEGEEILGQLPLMAEEMRSARIGDPRAEGQNSAPHSALGADSTLLSSIDKLSLKCEVF
jgi:hypothetical protein